MDNNEIKIVINAGHFVGMDCGAVGHGLQEADINLSVSHLIVDKLKDKGYNAILVSHDELYDITAESNAFGADVFVSIHCNASNANMAQGTETYHHPFSDQGRILATKVQSALLSNVHDLINRGVKTSNFYVLNHTDCPAILVELAFISNFYDAQILRNRQEELASAVVQGIEDYF